MIVRDVYRGRSMVMVTLAEVDAAHKDDNDLLIDAAVDGINDRRDRFFDHRVERFSQTPTIVNVFLYTS